MTHAPDDSQTRRGRVLGVLAERAAPARPDLAAARKRIEAEELVVRLERASRRPRVLVAAAACALVLSCAAFAAGSYLRDRALARADAGESELAVLAQRPMEAEMSSLVADIFNSTGF